MTEASSRHRWLWPLIALLGGVLWACCFGRGGLLLAPWGALVPLFPLLGGRRPALLTWIHGTAFWTVGLYWIPATLASFGGIPGPLSWLGVLLLAAFLSLLFWVPFGWFGSGLWRAGGWRALLGLPALWVALEWLREYLFSGFPWNVAAYAVVEVPGALPLSAWIGAYGVSALVLLVNVAGALWLRSGRVRIWAATVAGVALLLAVGAVSAPEPSGASGASEFRVLQPNIPNLVRYEQETVDRNYRRMRGMAGEACREPALLVLPESGFWPYEYDRHPFLAEDLDAIADNGCPLLVNSITRQGEGLPYLNSVLLVGPDGPTGRYDKRQLVPFGEYVPFKGVLPFLDKLARAAGDFDRGDGPALLEWQGHRIGVAVCYEVIYPTLVAEQVAAGATVLVTVVNDAWYGDTWAPWQHLRGARFRAAESRRTLLRAAITGVSVVVGPDGEVEQQLGVGEEGTLRVAVAPATDLTPYSRLPWGPPAVMSLLAMIAWLSRSGSFPRPFAGRRDAR